MNIRTIAVLAVVAVLAGVSFMGFQTWRRAGEGTTLVARFDGECTRLDGYIGAEDLVLDPETRIVYAAGEDRRALLAGQPARGAIWAIPLDAPETGDHVDLTVGAPEEFNAHGIDLYVAPDGTRFILAVNHTQAGDRIELFRLDAGRLVHLKTFADPLIAHINDVVALEPEIFYATHDKDAETGSFGEILEGALEKKTGSVVFYDQGAAREVADGLQYANGINISADGGKLYVAETTGRSLTIYDRDPVTNDLTFADRVFVGTGVDNITVDAAGRLFIAAHPKLLTFALGHAKDPAKHSPSQVVVIDPAAKTVDQVFLSLGADLSGSTTAVVDVDARRMLIGSVFEPHILSCALPEVWRHSESHPAARPE